MYLMGFSYARLMPKTNARATSLLALATLILPAFAGCVETLTPAAVIPASNAATLTLDLPVHVVAVGFPSFDTDALRMNLVAPPVVYPMSRLDTTSLIQPEALQYHITYEIHEAPAGFAHELFAFAASIAKSAPVDEWLAEHDRDGLQRICKPGILPTTPSPPVRLPVTAPPDPTIPACAEVQRIDALAVESWIDEHRAEAGLVFPQPGYTVFLLNSWDTDGLSKVTYHQYVVEDNQTHDAMETLRAWGGNHDFVFLDVGAAPNRIDYKPWANMTEGYSRKRLMDLTDPPIFEVETNATLYSNLGRHISDAAHILWARPPLYRFEYADKYELPVTIFIDPQAHANPDSIQSKINPLDYERHTNQAAFKQAFQDLAPWANVTASFKFVMLPDGDPDMMDALRDARSRYGGKYVDFSIVKHYLRTHWSEYVPDAAPGTRIYPTFAFILDAPSEALYAYADGDEVGDSFGVFFNVQDTFTCTEKVPPVCNTAGYERFGTQAAWWEWWNGVLVHEIGHSFGLNHAHDASSPDENGFDSYILNWLWDSTASIMSYRYHGPQFSRFDKDVVLRGNAVSMASAVLAKPDASPAARDAAEQALDHTRRGEYRAALDAARIAWHEADATLPPALQGTPGEPIVLTFDFHGTPGLDNYLPIDKPDLLLRPEAERASFPITIPPDAKGILIEYDEHDAPSHAGWVANLYVTNGEHDVVLDLGNAHDRAVLLGLHHCDSGCTGHLVAYSGVATSYTVKQTPYH